MSPTNDVTIPPSPARTRIMAAIRAKNTKPELLVRQKLHAEGFRFRLHRKDLPGKPDIVLPRYKVAVMVNGCFWHGHSCKSGFRLPATNQDFWKAKIERTRERDRAATERLTKLGWVIVTIWECELPEATERLLSYLNDRRCGERK